MHNACEINDVLNARMGAYDSAEIVVRKYTVMKVFKNSGLVDFVIGVFCLAYNGQQVADWFRTCQNYHYFSLGVRK